MSIIGIIVDGPGDKAALDAKFKKGFRVLKTDGPRGHCATVDKIISRSRKQISILESLRCKKIIILLDFECRKGSSKDFISSLDKEINRAKFNIDVLVVVPNQMIENWYLADIEILSAHKNFIKDNLNQKKYEGRNGKKILKELFVSKYSYNEVKHGKQIFPIIRDEVAVLNSRSYSDFLSKIK